MSPEQEEYKQQVALKQAAIASAIDAGDSVDSDHIKQKQAEILKLEKKIHEQPAHHDLSKLHANAANREQKWANFSKREEEPLKALGGNTEEQNKPTFCLIDLAYL